MSHRAARSGVAADNQKKIMANYSEEEAAKCLAWIAMVMEGDPDVTFPASEAEVLSQGMAKHDAFGDILYNGKIICKLINKLTGKVNVSDKMFKDPPNEAMRKMRERERIALFTKLCQDYGVMDAYAFPTESLHDKGVQNLNQVCNCIRALGIEAQAKGVGPSSYWPQKGHSNRREFTEEQMKAGQNVVSLQYGSNKGASQAGMTMGKNRQILD